MMNQNLDDCFYFYADEIQSNAESDILFSCKNVMKCSINKYTITS